MHHCKNYLLILSEINIVQKYWSIAQRIEQECIANHSLQFVRH